MSSACSFEVRERARSKSVDKGIRKFSKNNFVLFGTQRETTTEILRMQRVPFEGTDLSLIARSWMREMHSRFGWSVSRTRGTFREIGNVAWFAFVKRTTPWNCPVLRRASLKISADLDREECKPRSLRSFQLRWLCHASCASLNNLRAPLALFLTIVKLFISIKCGKAKLCASITVSCFDTTNSDTESINVS